MNTIHLIAKKQAGNELTETEIEFFINSYVAGGIPDYQMAAFLMAVYYQEMSRDETYYLTKAMLESGERFKHSSTTSIRADKHSTGGVGDKVSIILAPLMAVAGLVIPMISGRALGHSGGTLDKLDSIPGFKSELSLHDAERKLNKVGALFLSQTNKLVPADKKIYALRHSTSTVKSIPLITASILSKKLAEGIESLVLDIKVGKGAFFKEQRYTLKLTDLLICISEKFNLKTSILFTAMDQPLGHAVGNWLEIKEAIDTLKGNGPDDLVDVILALGAEMLVQTNMEKSISVATKKLSEILDSGVAFDKFMEIIKIQGGKTRYISNPELYHTTKYNYVIESERSGYVSDINAFHIGTLAVELGAGRLKMTDKIDYRSGIYLRKKVGNPVERGEPIADIFTDLNTSQQILKNKVLDALKISKSKNFPPSPVIGYATKEGMSKWPYF